MLEPRAAKSPLVRSPSPHALAQHARQDQTLEGELRVAGTGGRRRRHVCARRERQAVSDLNRGIATSPSHWSPQKDAALRTVARSPHGSDGERAADPQTHLLARHGRSQDSSANAVETGSGRKPPCQPPGGRRAPGKPLSSVASMATQHLHPECRAQGGRPSPAAWHLARTGARRESPRRDANPAGRGSGVPVACRPAGVRAVEAAHHEAATPTGTRGPCRPAHHDRGVAADGCAPRTPPRDGRRPFAQLTRPRSALEKARCGCWGRVRAGVPDLGLTEKGSQLPR